MSHVIADSDNVDVRVTAPSLEFNRVTLRVLWQQQTLFTAVLADNAAKAHVPELTARVRLNDGRLESCGPLVPLPSEMESL